MALNVCTFEACASFECLARGACAAAVGGGSSGVEALAAISCSGEQLVQDSLLVASVCVSLLDIM